MIPEDTLGRDKMDKPIHSQDYVNCPFCNGKSYYIYLETDGVGNDRVFECEYNKLHRCKVDEDLFWREKDG